MKLRSEKRLTEYNNWCAGVNTTSTNGCFNDGDIHLYHQAVCLCVSRYGSEFAIKRSQVRLLSIHFHAASCLQTSLSVTKVQFGTGHMVVMYCSLQRNVTIGLSSHWSKSGLIQEQEYGKFALFNLTMPMQTITWEPCFHRVHRAIYEVTEPIPHAQQTEVYISDAKSKK